MWRVFIVLLLSVSLHADEPSAQDYVIAARKLYQAGKFKEAIVGYQKAIQLEQERADLYLERGRIKKEMGKLFAANIDFSIALLFDESLAEAWLERGISWYQLGQPEKAEYDLSRALQLDEKRYESWFWRGMVFRELGKLNEAEICFRKAIGLRPDQAESWYNLGQTQAGLGMTLAAMESMAEAIRINKKESAYHLTRGLAALQHANSLIKDRQAFYNLARSNFKAALELNPKLKEPADALILLDYYEKSDKDALAKLMKAVKNGDGYRIFRPWLLARTSGQNADLLLTKAKPTSAIQEKLKGYLTGTVLLKDLLKHKGSGEVRHQLRFYAGLHLHLAGETKKGIKLIRSGLAADLACEQIMIRYFINLEKTE